MNLPFEFSLSALEEEIIDDKLLEGRRGLEFLLLNINEVGMEDYPFLVKVAGVADSRHDLMEFAFDSLRMTPDEFYDRYGVNFWIARGMNLQRLANEYNAFNSAEKHFVLKYLEKKIMKEDRS